MNCPGMTTPPGPRRGVLVTYLDPLFHAEITHRCAQTPGLASPVRHEPSFTGCRNVMKSTSPSSSPELGTPSGPSLSNADQTVSPPGRFDMESSTEISMRPKRWPPSGHELNTPMPLQFC